MPGSQGPHHSAKMKQCVSDLMDKGHAQDSAYAICTTSLQKAGEPIFEAAAAAGSDKEYFLTRYLGMRTCKLKFEDKKYYLYTKDGSKKLAECSSYDDLLALEERIQQLGLTDAELKDLRDITEKVREKADSEDFAGPDRSFPILKPEDVAAAVHSLGRTKGDPEEVKKRIIEIAYRKGSAYVSQLPDDWKRSSRAASEIQLHLCGALGKSRSVTSNATDYLVVPVIALMEGVIHPVNAATPEFVPTDTLRRAAGSFNGRPIVVGHPVKDGKQCSANEPSIMESHAIGTVFNARVEGSRLLCEAWIDKKKAAKVHPEMLSRLMADKVEEVSVGAFVTADYVEGTHNGKSYKAKWLDATGDHLAFLPGGRGACSVEMGCGACRAAEAYEVTERGFRVAGGPGSGNFGHAGRPGEVGGSSSGDGGSSSGSGSSEEAKVSLAKSILGDHSEEADTWIKATLDEDENYFENKSVQEIRKTFEKETGRKVNVGKVEIPKTPDSLQRKRIREINQHYDEVNRLHQEGRHREADLLQKKRNLSADFEDIRTLIGARNNAEDAKTIQSMHDMSMMLGAKCDRSNYKMMEDHGHAACGCKSAAGECSCKEK